ncbi:MAG: hypothetical protein ABFS32_21080 [Bacteroidota bacterium]
MSENFSLEELNQHWQSYSAIKKETGKNQEIMLLKEPYALNGYEIELTLSNEVLKITFDNLKADLQGYLRKNLKNNKLILKAVIKETAKEDMIYTNREKFEHLAKKHPALKELEDRLGLDPDY